MVSLGIDVLLINPPFRLVPPFKYKLIDPPRNLGLLAAVLRNNGFSVKILDMPILEQGFEEIIPTIEKEAPKLIGISNRSTYSFPIVNKVASLIKEYDDSIPIVAGGTYVSFAPEEALKKCSSLDYIVIGEGEQPLINLTRGLLNRTSLTEIPNIAYRDGAHMPVLSPKSSPIEDLGQIPLPSIDLLPMERYVKRNERYILDISRGCSNACPYCTSSFVKNHIRFRPVDLIVKEILIAYEIGFRNFYFFDDIFTANKELVQEVCKQIIDHKLEIKWPCMSRIDSIDEETLKWMKLAGCDLIAYGVETASKKALEEIGKSDQLEKIQSVFSLTKKHGIRPLAFVIFGMPKNSLIDELHTIKFLSALQPDAIGVFCFKPFPGTIYYSEPEKFGLKIFNNDFTRWSIMDEPTHETEYMIKDEIIEAMLICNYIFRSGGSFSVGTKFRRKRGVLVLKTREGGLLYNPYLTQDKRKTDMYLNGVKLDPFYFEVIYRCDGYHNFDDLTAYVGKYFCLNPSQSSAKVNEVLDQAVDLGVVEEVPDVMCGIEDIQRGALINGGGLV